MVGIFVAVNLINLSTTEQCLAVHYSFTTICAIKIQRPKSDPLVDLSNFLYIY